MSKGKDEEKDLEALVEEQAKQEGAEGEEATAEAELDLRKSKYSHGLSQPSAGGS